MGIGVLATTGDFASQAPASADHSLDTIK